MHPKILINCDGGSRGNPGPAALGLLLRLPSGQLLKTHAEKIGVATNNEAEYRALIKALSLAKEFTREEVRVFMDSELVVRQVTGQYKIKLPHLQILYQQVKIAERAFLSVVYQSVPRSDEYQQLADRLVNLALDARMKHRSTII